jgi:hypothetical protein
VAVREPFTAQAARLDRQLNWLIDLQRLLDPTTGTPSQPPTGAEVSARVDEYLCTLNQRTELDETDMAIAQHVAQTFRNRWWGLFRCYDVPGLPSTNNDLETFFGRLKTNQRRVTGCKSVNSFVLRYGAYAAFVDLSEPKAELLARLRQVDRVAYKRERQQLQTILAEVRDQHRFRHKRDLALQELELEWVAAVEAASQLQEIDASAKDEHQPTNLS